MREFWNSEITGASWTKLLELSKEFEFTLIGGWAVYLYTKLQKSKDINIVVDYPMLRQLGGRYRIEKDERLFKYEVKMDMFDIDVYLPSYSRLALPANELIGRYATRVEGIKVPIPEALMVLKLGAARERLASRKGEKDAIDILGLLFYSGMSIEEMKRIAIGHDADYCVRLLLDVLKGFEQRNIDYLNLNAASFAKLKKKHIGVIKENL